jgi:hypothetical protein
MFSAMMALHTSSKINEIYDENYDSKKIHWKLDQIFLPVDNFWCNIFLRFMSSTRTIFWHAFFCFSHEKKRDHVVDVACEISQIHFRVSVSNRIARSLFTFSWHHSECEKFFVFTGKKVDKVKNSSVSFICSSWPSNYSNNEVYNNISWRLSHSNEN